jgi:outer membrane lipoprotein LolB
VLSRATGLLAGVIWLLCAGCSTLGSAQHDSSATFYSHGRLSVHYRDLQSGKEDTVFGRFDWVEHGSTVDLSLLDPLGQSIAIVHSEPGSATLKLSDGRTFDGTSAEDLTREALGYTVPIAGLRSWLLGRAEDPSLKPSIDADGALVFHEMDWTVKYPDAVLPPKRIDLSYPGPGVSLDLRLAIEAPDAT